jgi:hypothetical protein
MLPGSLRLSRRHGASINQFFGGLRLEPDGAANADKLKLTSPNFLSHSRGPQSYGLCKLLNRH